MNKEDPAVPADSVLAPVIWMVILYDMWHSHACIWGHPSEDAGHFQVFCPIYTHNTVAHNSGFELATPLRLIHSQSVSTEGTTTYCIIFIIFT